MPASRFLYVLSLFTRIILLYVLSIYTLARAVRLRSDQQVGRQYQTIPAITTLPVILLVALNEKRGKKCIFAVDDTAFVLGRITDALGAHYWMIPD